MHAELVTRHAAAHPSAVEEDVQPPGQILRAALPWGVEEPPEREDRDVLRRHNLGAEPGPPQLHERRVLPRVRSGPLNAGMDREDGGPRHAVLEASPGRFPQRCGARRQPLVECPDGPSIGEDLLTRQLEPPGFLALNYGARTPVSVVVAHLVFGIVLGAFYVVRR